MKTIVLFFSLLYLPVLLYAQDEMRLLYKIEIESQKKSGSTMLVGQASGAINAYINTDITGVTSYTKRIASANDDTNNGCSMPFVYMSPGDYCEYAVQGTSVKQGAVVYSGSDTNISFEIIINEEIDDSMTTCGSTNINKYKQTNDLTLGEWFEYEKTFITGLPNCYMNGNNTLFDIRVSVLLFVDYVSNMAPVVTQ
ncbi:hypothetical protein V6R21_04360 [Limibacter armeniacum]|uniref:hypothetical protein n=1 Tax=Limibacter armeniacum TaxID=466084 RepID=UPI002FE55B37